MRKVLGLVIDNPLATALVVAFMALAGVYSARHMAVDLFPDLEIPVVNIITHYRGASPKDMELLISRPIENEMRAIPGVKRVASTSRQGISMVTAEFSWGIAVRDARQLVQTRLARLAGVLPTGISPRLENIGTTLQEVCGFVVYGGSDPVALRNIVAYDLVPRLMDAKGVSSIDMLGGEQRAFYVEIDPKELVSLKLGVNDIASILKKCNVSTVAGYIDSCGKEYLIRGDARLKTLADISSVPLCKKGKNSLLLGAVANVYQGYAPKHYLVSGDGFPAVAIIVRKQPGTSTIRVVNGVESAVSSLKNLFPKGTRIEKFYDQSEIIEESQDEIIRDIWIGALLAVLVLYFFLGSLRPTLIVAFTIPITFAATIAAMKWLGMSLNVITMTALALAIGMVVDDSIVVMENIYRRAHLGLSAREASIEGTLEIAGADISGTLTTIAAFLPLVLVSGLAALFMRPFGVTISAALLISLLLSLSLVPTMLGSREAFAKKNRSPGLRLVAAIDVALQKNLRFFFRHKLLLLGLCLLFLVLAVGAAYFSEVAVLPPIDEGSLLVEYILPPGTALSESERIGKALDKIAMADPAVSCVYWRSGSPGNGYQIEGVNKGELLIKLRPKNARSRSADEIADTLKKSYSHFDGVVFLYHQPTQEKIDESFSGLPALFGVTIYGTNVDTLIALAAQVESTLSKDPDVSNIVNNTKVKVPQLEIRVKYPKLAQYTVDVAQVLSTLKAARFGLEATQIVWQKEQVAVLVKIAGVAKMDVDSIGQLPITGAGDRISLAQVADIAVCHAPAAITRLNGQRQITLLAEVEGNIPAVVKRLRHKFQSIDLPKGYSIDFSGQYKVLIETAIEMLFAVIAAVVLIYLIMAMQFRSWLQPLIILFTIPVSLAGASIALFLAHRKLDVSVAMGAITLVGIAVNNAIVLIDCANKKIACKEKPTYALSSAASTRLRPILLTTLTTIAALLPVAFGTTVGSKIFQPFAVAVIGGLTSGTFASLIVVPTLASMWRHSHRHI